MDTQKNITDWLKTLKGWQTELAYRILTKIIEDADMNDFISMIKSNANFEDKAFPNFLNTNNEKQVKLLSIESIQNIESLAPRNPLKIIKKISGKPRAINLKSNVFNPNPNGKCVVKYSIDNIEQEVEWGINNSQITDLKTIDVFDTTTGNGYIDEANTVTYTPRFVKLFTAISHYYSKIQEKLEHEKLILAKTLSNIPHEYALTEAGKLYNSLKKEHTVQYLTSIFTWNDENEQVRLSVEKRLKEKDPAK